MHYDYQFSTVSSVGYIFSSECLSYYAYFLVFSSFLLCTIHVNKFTVISAALVIFGDVRKHDVTLQRNMRLRQIESEEKEEVCESMV